jgi:hypothetical protein
MLRSEVLDTAVHCTFRLLNIISSDTIVGDHMPITSYKFHPARTTKFSALLNKLIDVEQLWGLDCELNHLELKFSL